MTATANALRRTLGITDLVLLTLGTVIGSGIFIVPGVVLRQTDGRLGVALLVWIVGGVVSFLGALTYAELGAMTPEAGGLYAYIRDAFGPLPAFLYGWSSILVIASGSVATLAVAFSAYFGQLVPVSPLIAKVVSVLVILVITVVNARGTRDSAAVENGTTTIKVAALIIIGIALFSAGHGWSSAGPMWPTNVTASVVSGFGAAMIGVLWAYEGWQYVTFAAGETRDPQRVFPRAIAMATFALIVLYLLANVGYVSAIGANAAAHSDHVAADATTAAFGPVAGKLLSAIVLVSIFSAANGLMLTAPRLYYAMACDRVFFRRLAQVNARTGTPIPAILLLAAWSAVLAVTGTFQQLLTYVVFAGWIFYGLGALAVFASRRRAPGAPRPFHTPGYPVTPIVFAVAAGLVVVNTFVAQPREAVIGLAVVLLGAPTFYIWRARSRATAVDSKEPALLS